MEKIFRKIASTNKTVFDPIAYQRLVTEEKKVTIHSFGSHVYSLSEWRLSLLRELEWWIFCLERKSCFGEGSWSDGSNSIKSDVCHRSEHVLSMVNQPPPSIFVIVLSSAIGLYKISFSTVSPKIPVNLKMWGWGWGVVFSRYLVTQSIPLVCHQCSGRNHGVPGRASGARSTGSQADVRCICYGLCDRGFSCRTHSNANDQEQPW